MSTPERSGRTILCIGNEPVHLNLRCSFLTQHGWAVRSSGSGHEGLLCFGAQAADAVILDFIDSGVEGALIAGELKRIRPNVPIIMLVAEKKTLVAGALESADAVLLRSDGHPKLLRVLKKLLDA